MEMNAIVKVNAIVDVTEEMALTVIFKELGCPMPKEDFCWKILESDDPNNPKKEKAIFKAERDTNYHGTNWIYTFVSSDEQKIKDFELANAIYKRIKEKGNVIKIEIF